MNPPLIILLCGRRHSGKTTVAWWLKNAYSAETIAVMEPLWQITKRLYDLDDEDITVAKDCRQEQGWTPREVAIELSTAMKAVLGEDFWIEAAARKIKAIAAVAADDNLIVTVDGIRPVSEVAAIKRQFNPTLVVKMVCENDLHAGEDAIETAVDEITPDLKIRWQREIGADLRDAILVAAFDAFLSYWTAHPEIIEFFDRMTIFDK